MEASRATRKEIKKALSLCVDAEKIGYKNCWQCPFREEYPLGCQAGLMYHTLDLIHRLQSEKKHLSEEYDRLGECFAKLKERNAEQKAEIERLTKWYDTQSSLYNNLQEENAELQKQVDELTANQIIECHGMLKGCDMVQQAVKDTAKEIYSEIDDSDILVVNTQEYGEIEVVPMQRLKEVVKSKGVEVE